MSAQVYRFPTPDERQAPTKRPRMRTRDLGLSPRQLGLNPRALEGLSADEIAQRVARAADTVRRRVPGPVAPPTPRRTPPRSTVERRKSAGIPGCPVCAGSGWADVEGNAVAPCECRDGVVL